MQTIKSILTASNVAPEPTRQFEIDPAVLLKAYKTARAGGPSIVGCYHSHPNGDLTPSGTDAAMAEAQGEFWIICDSQGGQATTWRAQRGGRLHGIFDPVRLVVD
jgi:proteasome lid subunit RPN8/RPN11